MPRNFAKSWFVFESIENDDGSRCTDLFRRPDGTFGFDEFRRDVEDGGVWTVTGNYSALVYPSRSAALSAAIETIGWLGDTAPFIDSGE
jgi:hypothetical protein